MKNYEDLYIDYVKYIKGMQEILNDEDWQEELNDLANLIFLSYTVREKLAEIAPKNFQQQLSKWDKALLDLTKILEKKHKPLYNYFKKIWEKNTFKLLHHYSSAMKVETASKA